MIRIAALIPLVLMGSTMAYWQSEIDRRNRYFLQQNYPNPTTRPSYYYSGSHVYVHSPGWFNSGYGGYSGSGGGYSGGYDDVGYSGGYTHTSSIAASSGVSRGGFGSIGHSMGGGHT